MESLRHHGNLQAVFFILITGIAMSATLVADGSSTSNGLSGRALLQEKAGCSVGFETLNYSVLTSNCKGPSYPKNSCCTSFKEFACPYAAELNDLTNNCATTMFSYINIQGSYPPGLFASICKEGKDGLDCTGYISQPSNATGDSNGGDKDRGGQIGRRFAPSAAIISAVFLLLFA